MRVEGVEGHAELARALNARRVPTPRGAGAWTHATVTRVLDWLDVASARAEPILVAGEPPRGLPFACGFTIARVKQQAGRFRRARR